MLIKHEIIQKLFDSLFQKYEKCPEESMTGTECVFDVFELLHYKCYKISLNHCESGIDSLKWLKNKTATINPKHNDKRFQYAKTVVLNHTNILKDPEIILKIKLFMDEYDWKEISFPSHKEE